jgi:hypothetical protein
MASLRRFLRSGTPGRETANRGGTSRTYFLRSFLGRFLPSPPWECWAGCTPIRSRAGRWESRAFGAGILGASWPWGPGPGPGRTRCTSWPRSSSWTAWPSPTRSSTRSWTWSWWRTRRGRDLRFALGEVHAGVRAGRGPGGWVVERHPGGPTESGRRRRLQRPAGEGEKVEEGWGEPYDRLILHRDGTHRWVRWRESPGPGRTIVGIGSDVTDRKKGEEASKRLAALVENTSEFVGYAWPEGTVEFINPGGRRLVGLEDDFDPVDDNHGGLRGSLRTGTGSGTRSSPRSWPGKAGRASSNSWTSQVGIPSPCTGASSPSWMRRADDPGPSAAPSWTSGSRSSWS